MNRARIAEWILSLALPAERATAVVGDLAESADERGHLWFWSCVIRLTGAKIWQDLSENPATMLWLGVRGFVASALAPAAFMVAIFVLLVLLEFRGHPDIRTRYDWIWTPLTMLWGFWIFRTGRTIASRTPGREIAACLAVAGIGWIALLAVAIFAQGRITERTSLLLVASVVMGLVYSLALFSGAVEARQKRMSGKSRA